MAPFQVSGLGVKWFEAAIRLVISWLRQPFERGLGDLAEHFFYTPLPPTGSGVERVFSAPPASDEPWHSIYNSVVAGEVMVLALLLLFICVQGRHAIRIFNVGSGYEARRAQRSAWTGAVLIVGWYWLAVLTLYFVEGLTVGLLPDLGGISSMLLSILPTALSNPALSLVMSLIGAAAMLCLEALLFLRQVLLYGYLYLMPIGIAVAFSNLPVLSKIARGLCRKFIPLAVLPIPAALLFRTYDLLFGNSYIALPTPFLRFLVVVSLPVISLYVSWKTFQYASPLTSRIIRNTTGAALTVGAAASAGSVASPRIASTAMRRGPKMAAGEAVIRRFAGPTANDRTTAESTARRPPGASSEGRSRRASAGTDNGSKSRDEQSVRSDRQEVAPAVSRMSTGTTSDSNPPVPPASIQTDRSGATDTSSSGESNEKPIDSRAHEDADNDTHSATDRERIDGTHESDRSNDGKRTEEIESDNGDDIDPSTAADSKWTDEPATRDDMNEPADTNRADGAAGPVRDSGDGEE